MGDCALISEAVPFLEEPLSAARFALALNNGEPHTAMQWQAVIQSNASHSCESGDPTEPTPSFWIESPRPKAKKALAFTTSSGCCASRWLVQNWNHTSHQLISTQEIMIQKGRPLLFLPVHTRTTRGPAAGPRLPDSQVLGAGRHRTTI